MVPKQPFARHAAYGGFGPNTTNAAEGMNGGYRPQLFNRLANMPVTNTAIRRKPAPPIQATGKE